MLSQKKVFKKGRPEDYRIISRFTKSRFLKISRNRLIHGFSRFMTISKKNRGRRLWAIVYLSCSASVCVSLNMSGYIWIFMSIILWIYPCVDLYLSLSLSIYLSIWRWGRERIHKHRIWMSISFSKQTLGNRHRRTDGRTDSRSTVMARQNMYVCIQTFMDADWH